MPCPILSIFAFQENHNFFELGSEFLSQVYSHLDSSPATVFIAVAYALMLVMSLHEYFIVLLVKQDKRCTIEVLVVRTNTSDFAYKHYFLNIVDRFDHFVL